MANDSKDSVRFWDRMYDREDYRYGTRPNAFMAAAIGKVARPGARVLCVGDGEGRNGVWLAEQGYLVTSVEPSSVGLSKALSLAIERDVPITLVRDRMPSNHVFVGGYDAVVLTYIHVPPAERPLLHQSVRNALAPDGVVLVEAFTPAQLRNARTSGGPKDEAMLYTADLLRGDFADLDIRVLEEVQTELDEGPGHSGTADVVRCIAVKS